MPSTDGVPGFHGKAPGFGDFLSRHLPPGFAGVWDDWLQSLVRKSRAQLGPAWLEAWLAAPVWHFGLGAGIAGTVRGFGVLIPSVDRVGRHFPFTILGLTQPGGKPLPVWALRVEALALGALEDGFDPARLATDLAALGAPADPPGQPAAAAGGSALADPGDWPAPVDAASATLVPGETLWWCRGAPRVPAVLLRCRGLPDAAMAASLISGIRT